jgi:hypothetical protein
LFELGLKLTTFRTWGTLSAFFPATRATVTGTRTAWWAMSTKAHVELLKAHVAAVVCVEAGEDGSDTLLGGALEGWQGCKFLKGKNTVFTSDFSKFFGALGGDSLADGLAGRFALFAGDFSVTIGVDFSATLFAGSFAGSLDGLTLLFVDDAVVVGVILLKELGESSVAEGFFVVLCHGNTSKESASDQDVC